MLKNPVIRAFGAVGVVMLLALGYVRMTAFALTGTVDAISDTEITVDGQVYQITADTEIKDTIAVGDVVDLDFTTAADGSLVATEIGLADAAAVTEEPTVEPSVTATDDSDDGVVDSTEEPTETEEATATATDDDQGEVEDDDQGEVEDDDDQGEVEDDDQGDVEDDDQGDVEDDDQGEVDEEGDSGEIDEEDGGTSMRTTVPTVAMAVLALAAVKPMTTTSAPTMMITTTKTQGTMSMVSRGETDEDVEEEDS